MYTAYDHIWSLYQLIQVVNGHDPQQLTRVCMGAGEGKKQQCGRQDFFPIRPNVFWPIKKEHRVRHELDQKMFDRGNSSETAEQNGNLT
jgi:hypothetical protein